MKSIVFDWGNTLMKVFPEYQGPMVDWPHVEVIPGVMTALEKLSGEYNLVVATSAKDSNAEQVKLALARVGLDKFFTKIFTIRELGFEKPAHQFFEKIRQLTDSNDFPLLVGDDYIKDICGGVNAGWDCAWYSYDLKICPAMLPLHHIELSCMDQLPDQLINLELPSVTESICWLISHHANMNLILHSQVVASVSYLLAKWIRDKGNQVDPVLAHRGGLLHDIAKLTMRNQDDYETDHAEMGAQILLDLHQSRLAEIARCHLISSLFDEKRSPRTWEQKIVHYADKVVEGASLVMLEERIQAICKRYPHHAERILGSVSGVKRLQSEICEEMGVSVDQLNINISNTFMGKFGD